MKTFNPLKTSLHLFCAAALAVGGVAGCTSNETHSDNLADEASRAIDEASDNVGEAADETGEAIEDGAEETGEAIEDGAEEAADEMEEATDEY
ncbi:MAG: hypothetical protein H6704_14490 [Myxococcales bacterium]|nr:hypothetical protein [Myxococcales bacterium]MCA9557239.1 hypothetical protein [Myxococcales bacterium]MCB9537459.1 hypothetical protein [Myxococcales bacterium]